MNDEYHHPIWINSASLSLDFHLVSAFLAFENGFTSRRLRHIVSSFHYASLAPKEVENRQIIRLVRHMKKLVKHQAMRKWFAFYEKDFCFTSFQSMQQNWVEDIDILVSQVGDSTKGHSLVYRKSVPDGIADKAVETLVRFEKFLEKQGK